MRTTSDPTLSEQLKAHFEEAPGFTAGSPISVLVMLMGGFYEPFGIVMGLGTAATLTCAAGLFSLRPSIDAHAKRLAVKRAQRAYQH